MWSGLAWRGVDQALIWRRRDSKAPFTTPTLGKINMLMIWLALGAPIWPPNRDSAWPDLTPDNSLYPITYQPELPTETSVYRSLCVFLVFVF